MLHAWEHPKTGELRLYIRGAPAEAWIANDVREGYQRGVDWALFVRSGQMTTAEKCPTQVEVASRLKAWLLSRFHRPLYTIRFSDLAKIADGTIR